MRWWWGLLCTKPISLVGFNSAISLKQQSADRHVAPLRNIILIPSQRVFALAPECCLLSGEATNTNFIVFGLTRSGLEPMIYRTLGEHTNHYTTNAVQNELMVLYLITTNYNIYSILFTGFVQVLESLESTWKTKVAKS
jgi:hypothetical protein